jgi:NAD(P) transhydrogenase subunit alpha
MKVGVPTETAERERRVALVPEVVKRLTGKGHEVLVQPGAGAGASIPDGQFADAGATLTDDVWGADVVIKVAPPNSEETSRIGSDTLLIGFLNPLGSPETTQALASAGATALAMEAIPRISRAQSMDALSSQANIGGYKAVLLATEHFGRFLPMLMTAAGTIPPAKVLVLGAGVAGLQALATAKRLGAKTTGYDVRPEVAEQVQSLGAQFLDLGISAVGGAATPASSPRRSARSSSRRSPTPSRTSTSSSRPRPCRAAGRRSSCARRPCRACVPAA